MTAREKRLVFQAIEALEERNKKAFENFANQNPNHRKRIETNRDLFLLATTMVRMELEQAIGQDERRAKA